MPLYDYDCPSCGKVVDVWAEIEEEAMQHQCGDTMRRLISPTRSNPDWQPYVDENLCKMGETGGTLVKSRQHRKQLMGEMGLTDKHGEGRKQRWV